MSTAVYTPVGIEITRRLLNMKLVGQARVAAELGPNVGAEVTGRYQFRRTDFYETHCGSCPCRINRRLTHALAFTSPFRQRAVSPARNHGASGPQG